MKKWLDVVYTYNRGCLPKVCYCVEADIFLGGYSHYWFGWGNGGMDCLTGLG